jgi:hypothetical protein
MILRVNQVLGADNEHLARLLHRVINAKSLFEIAGQRLFAVDVLAGIERIDRDICMPIVHGGHNHGIDIFAFQ